jgi:hypothetical protein
MSAVGSICIRFVYVFFLFFFPFQFEKEKEKKKAGISCISGTQQRAMSWLYLAQFSQQCLETDSLSCVMSPAALDQRGPLRRTLLHVRRHP